MQTRNHTNHKSYFMSIQNFILRMSFEILTHFYMNELINSPNYGTPHSCTKARLWVRSDCFVLKFCSKVIFSSTDLEWVSKVRVNTQAVLKRAQQVQGRKVAKKQWQVRECWQTADTKLNMCLWEACDPKVSSFTGSLAPEGCDVHWPDDTLWWWYTV